MNTNHIKSYAPQARSAFIAAMTKQAAKYGITAKGIEPLEQKGELALIGDRPFPASIIRPRAALVQKVAQLGFAQAMEQAAYSWFNRLCAIRFMELKGYLDHGLRVLSHPSQEGSFQILDDCLNIELPGLDKQRITELKLDGNQDEALYRELLLAQCHALHQAMPFLFEAIDDQTELLLPDNLTKTDSLIRELVDAIPEEDWQDVEIIGWLYQFYISEKKDQVIGKVVKSEDIPAATQLFTPNWIVKYMVQNSLGAQWLATYPDSPLKAQMEYYIEPAEQTDEVNAQLAAITPSALNPEELTLIDPACGSGHILVEGYDLFKAIYLERGYRQRDLPQLILEKNLFGLDIDGRAAQLTGFALMMKGRADDRRLFERGVKLNVMALVDSGDFDAETVINGFNLGQYGLQAGDLTELKRLFEHATTFGSLIQVQEGLAKNLPGLMQLSEVNSSDIFVSEELKSLRTLVRQAGLLATQYDVVLANPPFMNGKYYNSLLKGFLTENYLAFRVNIFAAFIARGLLLTKPSGSAGYVTPFVWMFISSFEDLRSLILESFSIRNLVKPSYTSFFESAIVSLVTFIIEKRSNDFRGTFFDLGYLGSAKSQPIKFKAGVDAPVCDYRYISGSGDFKKTPGSRLAYWLSAHERNLYESGSTLDSMTKPRKGIDTGDNGTFLRMWWEVPNGHLTTSDQVLLEKWFPYNKGGDFRRWFGNREHVVNWCSDGAEIRARLGWTKKKPTIRNAQHFCEEGFTWSTVSSGNFSARYTPRGAIFDNGGCTLFCSDPADLSEAGALLNSKVAQRYLDFLAPTVNFQPGDVGKILYKKVHGRPPVQNLIDISRVDWNAYERSWDFQSFPILTELSEPRLTLESSYTSLIDQNRANIAKMKRLEEENNRLFIEAYGLEGELTPDVPIEQITLTVNPAYRYGGKMTEEELWTRFREDSMHELVSYAIGCMMGRYSPDEPGLIYAHSGNEGFDSSRYTTFPADDDGIIPLTDKEWFADDAANRLVEFIALTWDKTHLEDNLRFLADNLSPKKGEGSRDTLRRYLCDSFFKDHLQTYKKRPIYWLFSSGKQKAFQCLVYLHRYNANTLARMRTLHVIPLSAKLNSYANKLEQDIDASTSTAEKKALEKQLATLHNQQAELATFDEKLRHHADLRITLDLDDGVKVNYGKFGDLLAEVKNVTGDKSTD